MLVLALRTTLDCLELNINLKIWHEVEALSNEVTEVSTGMPVSLTDWDRQHNRA